MNYFNESVNEISMRGASVSDFSYTLHVPSSVFGVWQDNIGICILLKLRGVRGV